MAYLPGTTIPLEWFYWIPIILVGSIIAYIVYKRRNSDSSPQVEGPIAEQNLGIVLKVDENGTLQVGKLLSGVKQTDKDLLITDPDIMDVQTGLPKEFHVAYEDIVPAQVIDAARSLITLWLFLYRKGEYVACSFASIVSQTRTRFDPLPADPRDVGGHYVPMPYSRSGLTQLLSSNTGKFLVIGACISLGIMFGLILGHVTHF